MGSRGGGFIWTGTAVLGLGPSPGIEAGEKRATSHAHAKVRAFGPV